MQDKDEFWMYDELKTRVVEPNALRTKYSNGTPTVKDKDSDKMIASRSVHVSHRHLCTALYHNMSESLFPTLCCAQSQLEAYHPQGESLPMH